MDNLLEELQVVLVWPELQNTYGDVCENTKPERLGWSQIMTGLECHAKDFGL